jgi:spermidine synthase
MALGLVFVALGLREQGRRRPFVVLGAALAVVAALLPSQRGLWLRLHGTAEQASLLEEDPSGVVALIPEKDKWTVWVGGRWNSALPFGDIHTLLGAAPAVIHPAPREVAIVGLGSGDTAASAGCRRDMDQHVTVFELYAPERRLLTLLARRPHAPADLVRWLEDPRFTYVIADGRNAIDRGGRLYDVIEADALLPTSPYAGNLYSLEFFKMCARHLRPGGLVTTWAPTPLSRATFLAALPHVVAIAEGVVLIGSGSPIRIDLPAWHARLLEPANSAYLGETRVSQVWEGLQAVRAVDGQGAAGSINRDLFPRDEFAPPTNSP